MLTETVRNDTLRRALETALERRFGASKPIARMDRHRSDYESSFRLEELSVTFADGASLTLMFKDLGFESLSREALLAKSRTRHEPLRELRVYEEILSPSGLGPDFYGAVVDEDIGHFWLFLEKIDGVELYQEGDLGIWQECARWLARMHIRFLEDPGRLTPSVPLLQYGRSRSEADLVHLQESSDPALQALAGALRPFYSGLLDQVFAWPRTFLHGDFYASNVLIRRGPSGREVVPVDWEMAGIGPGLLDLAALTSGRWDALQRMAMATQYHAVWSREYDAAQSLSAFLRALDGARLMASLRWLTAPPQWKPPADHARDWYAESCDIARSLGLASRPN